MSVNEPLVHDQDVPEIQKWIMKGSDFLKQNLVGTVLVAVAVGGGLGGYSYYQSQNREKAAVAWNKFSKAQTAADYGELATEFKDSEIAVWARLSEAERELAEGIRLQFTDRKSAEAELKKAKEAFDFVTKGGASMPVAMERAHLGMARLLEATSDGNLSEALDAFKAFATKYPNSIYKPLVEQRIKAIDSPTAKDFYAWFAKQSPRPEDRKTPRDMLPPGHPDIETPITLPPIPDELYPANWTELKLDGDTPASQAEAKESTTEPAAPKSENKPAEAAKSGDKPAEEKPASDADKK